MAPILDLRRLRYFAAIAEHGSLSGAARALNIAQPALSHHVGQIEASLKSKLLNRHRDGVTLTSAGQLLLLHALAIIDGVDRAEAELLALAGRKDAGIRLRLAIISSIAADLTPILLAEFKQALPRVTLRITEASTLDSLGLIDEGKADLAISLAPHKDLNPVAWERLHLVSRDDGQAARGDISLADALDLPLILPARTNPLRELVEAEAGRIGRSVDVTLEIDGPTSRMRAILSGHGSTILGTHSILGLSGMDNLLVRPIGPPAIRRPLYMDARQGLSRDLVETARGALAAALARLGSLDIIDACATDHSLSR